MKDDLPFVLLYELLDVQEDVGQQLRRQQPRDLHNKSNIKILKCSRFQNQQKV